MPGHILHFHGVRKLRRRGVSAIPTWAEVHLSDRLQRHDRRHRHRCRHRRQRHHHHHHGHDRRDFVDRGHNSVETLTLLLCLKVRDLDSPSPQSVDIHSPAQPQERPTAASLHSPMCGKTALSSHLTQLTSPHLISPPSHPAWSTSSAGAVSGPHDLAEREPRVASNHTGLWLL
jgi:hypothetical protein